MQGEIVFADASTENELQSIFKSCGMDLAGNIEEHVIVIADNEIWGGGMLIQLDQNEFHLLVLAVKQEDRNRGLGSLILKELIKWPWKYCHDGTLPFGNDYRVTTVARGKSREFYKRNGFIICDSSALSYPFGQQCDECPDRGNCNSAAMVFKGKVR